MNEAQLHASCVAYPLKDAFVGVLLRGPSGSGKSDLALRLVDRGAKLVADDLVLLSAREGVLIARAPETIRGRMEVRGLGIVSVPAVDEARVALLIDLVPASGVPRLPESKFEEICGIAIPSLALNPFEISCVAKIGLAFQVLMEKPKPGVTFPFACR